MNLAALRQELAAQHVNLSLSPTGRLRYEAPQPISSELLEGLKAHRDELLAELHRAAGSESHVISRHVPEHPKPESFIIFHHGSEEPVPEIPAEVVIRRHELAAPAAEELVKSRHDSSTVPGLSAPLAHLVAAAASDRIKGGAQLPSGMVMDLGAYVLAWAAAYLVGDQAQALARLQEARAVWGQS